MQARFTPSLETLGDRLNLSPWVPTTEPTRQVSIVQDLSPPGDSYALRVESLDVTEVSVVVYASREVGEGPASYNWAYLLRRDASTTLEGHECLVFFLGGIPSEVTPKYWVFGTELPPDASQPIRHRMFAIVDRTAFHDDSEANRRNLVTTLSIDLERPGSGVDRIQTSLLIAKQQARRSADGELALTDEPTAEQDRVGPFFEFKSNRLVRPAAEDGRDYKMLFAPLILELDTSKVDTDDLVGWDFAPSANDAQSRPSVLLQRLANPSLPTESGNTDPYSFALDGKSSGL